MFGSSVGNLFKISDKPLDVGDVREGATYRHKRPGELTETAKVVHVGPDATARRCAWGGSGLGTEARIALYHHDRAQARAAGPTC